MDKSEDKWSKLEEIVRKIFKQELEKHEISLLTNLQTKRKPKVELVGGKWIGITPDMREAWTAAYGSVNIEDELTKSAAWCMANPLKAPRSQIPRFLNAWLSREQNRASIRSIPTERPTAITPSLCEYCRKPATGAVGGRRACDEHFGDAMNGTKPQQFMPGVPAKQVVPD